MRIGENRRERVAMACISPCSTQCRESWIQEILIENLLGRLCIKSQIYVPRLGYLAVTASDFPWAAGNL
jgi:hypothetical protein